MNYFILPKINNNKILLRLNNKTNPCISTSYLYQYSKLNSQLSDNEYFNDFEMFKLVNPYMYLQIPIDEFNYISKIIQDNDIFFNLIEIINNFNLFDKYAKISIFYDEVEEKIVKDIMKFHKDISYTLNDNKKYDLLIYNINDTQYTSTNFIYILLKILYIIINSQIIGGFSVFKINNIFSHVIIEFLFVLSNLYDNKIIIFKPLSGSNISNERFIICKNFNIKNVSQYQTLNNDLIDILNIKNSQIKNPLTEPEPQPQHFEPNSFLNIDVPLFFLNKIEECNIIIGHSQLDYLYKIINNLKFNLKNIDKIENIKKSNIKKCMAWCEKYQMPYNKIENSERSINIFT